MAISGLLHGQKTQEKPNIIFILIDDMGWEDLNCYGSTFYETPNIDRLAANGIKFTQAYASCPVSSPTRASVLTGKYPVKTDVTDWIPGRQNAVGPESHHRLICQPFAQQLALEEITIAEELKKAGYRTASIGKWHLGGDQFLPQYQGFDTNIGGTQWGHPHGGKGYFYPFGAPIKGKDGDFLTNNLTDEVIHFVEQNQKNPFFIYFPNYAVHNPIMAPDSTIQRFEAKRKKLGYANGQIFDTLCPWIQVLPPSMKKGFKERKLQDKADYAALIANLDQNVGRLMQRLKQLNLLDNTMIIFTSDNGGLSTSEGSNTSNAPLRTGKGWMYEGGTRVPAIIYYPKMIKKGRVSDEIITSPDYFPTLLELAGIKTSVQGIDGKSLVPVMNGKNLAQRPVFWHYPHYSNQGGTSPFSSVILGDFKLIEFYEDNHVELYNLKEDISEAKDLSKAMPDKVEELKKILDNWKKSVNAKIPLPNIDYKKN